MRSKRNIGDKIGYWTILSNSVYVGKGHHKRLCRCVCGTEKYVYCSNLSQGSSSCGCKKIEKLKSKALPIEEVKQRRAYKSSIKDKTPKRREQKRLAMMKYNVSTKAIVAFFNRWLKKKNKTKLISDEQLIDLRKNPCYKCGRLIEGLGLGFEIINTRREITLDNVRPCCGICKLIKPKDKFDVYKFSMAVLRRVWKKTPMAALAKIKAKVKRGRFKCAQCGQLFKEKEIQIDHILPVVDVEKGLSDLNTFAIRLFCDDSNLQVLCKGCHLIKTKRENSLRAEFRKGLKNGK